MTRIQKLTIAFIVLYLLWEYVILASWKANTDGPLIRVDLMIIYPLLAIGIIISIWQYFKN
ncbi:hypothetical protein [Formosa sp. S-31]|uniref:hypothetical protein n=1 Tax=Formosa sp. S-31 TaxID=2790949 RepID=UPI003EBD4FCF